MSAIYKTGIVGGGVMGRGLARLFVRRVPVTLKEVSIEKTQNAYAAICADIERAARSDRISFEEAERQMALIFATAEYAPFDDVDIAIEAVWENLATKKEVLAALDAVMPPHGIIASNTSGSFLISELAAFTSRPDKVIGMHFFNPPTQMPLVEVIRGEQTSRETVDTAVAFAREILGKIVIQPKDSRGFLTDRVVYPYLNEAALALAEVDLDPSSIDTTAKDFGWPMGPFMLLDAVVGLDVARDVAGALRGEYGERMKPAELLLYLAEQGRFGRKSGAGVYTHDLATEDDYEPVGRILARLFPNRPPGDPKEVFRRMMLAMINEAARCLEEEVASLEDIETACVFGLGFPQKEGMQRRGILRYADEQGISTVVAGLEALEGACGSRFSPAQILRDKAAEGSVFFETW